MSDRRSALWHPKRGLVAQAVADGALADGKQQSELLLRKAGEVGEAKTDVQFLLIGRPLAARTIRNALARLHKALTAAQISKYIAHNPADHVNLPSAEHKPIHKHVLTIEECQKLLGHLKGHRLYGLFFLALATGMRQAELLGLTWRSIDFRRGTITISQQLQRQRARASGSDVAAKQWSLEPTKTKAGNRTLSMSTAVAGVLRNLQQQREEERASAGEAWCDTFVEDGGLLFTTSEGQPLYGSQIYKFLKSCLKQLGLPDITFHDLRHTAATLLLHEGYSSGSVAEIFGHSNKGVTDSIYAHGLVAVKVEALDRISRMLEYSGELPREEGTSTRNLGQNDRESSRDFHSDSQLPNDRKL